MVNNPWHWGCGIGGGTKSLKPPKAKRWYGDNFLYILKFHVILQGCIYYWLIWTHISHFCQKRTNSECIHQTKRENGEEKRWSFKNYRPTCPKNNGTNVVLLSQTNLPHEHSEHFRRSHISTSMENLKGFKGHTQPSQCHQEIALLEFRDSLDLPPPNMPPMANVMIPGGDEPAS